MITIEIVGEFLGYDGDEAIWEYFKPHWAAWFLKQRPRWCLKLLRWFRKQLEIVISQLEQRFGLAKMRARNACWHLTNPRGAIRLIRIMKKWDFYSRTRERLMWHSAMLPDGRRFLPVEDLLAGRKSLNIQFVVAAHQVLIPIH